MSLHAPKLSLRGQESHGLPGKRLAEKERQTPGRCKLTLEVDKGGGGHLTGRGEKKKKLQMTRSGGKGTLSLTKNKLQGGGKAGGKKEKYKPSRGTGRGNRGKEMRRSVAPYNDSKT